MQRSKEELEAAADVCERTAAHRGISGVAYPQFELAAKACRIVAAGMDGFEAWWETGANEPILCEFGTMLYNTERRAYLAGRASLQADLDAKQRIIECGCQDWAEDHTAIENMLKERGIDTTGDDFVDIVEFVERLCAGFDAMADEVERLGSVVAQTRGPEYYDQRVSDILAERRKEHQP